MKEAKLYKKLPENKVRCYLCAHRCLIAEGKKGICQVRENQGGTLRTLVYGRTIAAHIDPIEKKPLMHFYPGSTAYSIATVGCNFRCQWCQNWNISQMVRERHLIMGEKNSPQQLIAAAKKAGCRSIAYTYTEPTIFFEYAYAIARLAHDAGLANIFVTNGYMTSKMLDAFHPYLDAANVDLKAFRDEVYKKYVGARLQPVLDSLKKMKELGIWVEVTTLVIPGVNDSDEELRNVAKFIANELGTETPWHISRFFPTYKMTDQPRTPLATLRRAREIGQEEGLRYLFIGNASGETNTICHACGQLLIKRSSYLILEKNIQPNGTCPNCGANAGGRFV